MDGILSQLEKYNNLRLTSSHQVSASFISMKVKQKNHVPSDA